jgi:hypothetical protein
VIQRLNVTYGRLNTSARVAEAPGYLTADECGDSFRLTWKGAIRVAWLGLWPMTFFRRAIHRHVMHLELQSLHPRAEAALQKA